MNDLMRPALYDAKHQFIPVIKQETQQKIYDFVGPVVKQQIYFTKIWHFHN